MSQLAPPVSSTMRTTSLASPAGALMRPTLRIEAVDSLTLASARFRQNGAAVLPVMENDLLVGVITDQVLARALAAGVEPTDAVRDWMIEPETIYNYESGAEALRRVEEGRTLVVIDEVRHALGLIAAADLWPRKRPQPRPAVVGGMATPFGVYLTTGSVSGGVPKWALVATGATMYAMMLVAGICVLLATPLLAQLKLPSGVLDAVTLPLIIALFLIMMRLVPLSGTHGAEHQVVHAIERDEELRPEVIRRMPRVHPRCGTNLAVGAGIFTAVFYADWPGQELHLIGAALATFLLWRPVGSVFQQYLTTKRPSDKQLAGGIKAGKMLLENFATAKTTFPSPWERIWNSGIFHVMAGALGMMGLTWLVGHLCNWDMLRLVS